MKDSAAHAWKDGAWMKTRGSRFSPDHPIAIYEIDPASWRRVPEQDNRPLTAAELAPQLVEYILELGFTHVQFLSIGGPSPKGSVEFGSFDPPAPADYLGSPSDVMSLIDQLHQNDIGVILDLIPGNVEFAAKPDPDLTGIGKLISDNALFWLDRYHLDGLHLRVRPEGEMVEFLKHLNETIYRVFPDIQTIADCSWDAPMVSQPTFAGGLGFGFNWDKVMTTAMLAYFAEDPINRKYHPDRLTFRGWQAFSGNPVLALSPRTMEGGKGSLLARMPGDEWQKFANLRLLLGYLYAQPGKKLLFMGGEFGQWKEWDPNTSLDWHLVQHDGRHRQMLRWVADLNRFYRQEPALHQTETSPGGFKWIDHSNSEMSVLTCVRRSPATGDTVMAAFNFTPVPRHNYRVGAPNGGYWREVLNSDALEFGGSGQGNLGGIESAPFGWQGEPHSLFITLPPLGAVFFKCAPTP